MEEIKVLIVDDQPVVRQGLASFLMAIPDLRLVGEAAGGEQAVELCSELEPDVMLMDLKMPVVDGVETTRRLLAGHPDLPVVVLTSYKEDDLVKDALEAGATSYLLKSVTAEELAQGIRTACRGETTLAQEVTEALIRAAVRPPEPEYNLTARECEVLELLVEGITNRKIAERLTVSTATAKFHVRNVLAKLGAESRAEAVAIALRRGLVGSRD